MADLLVTSQVGLREDLSDLITTVDAKSKPLLALAKKGHDLVNPDVHSWQADAYDTPDFSGVLSDADIATGTGNVGSGYTGFVNPAQNRQKLSGRCQKFRKGIMVDDFAGNISDVAGVGQKKELARGAARGIEEIGRGMELAFCSDKDSVQQNGANPYITRGLGCWIQNGAQTDLPVAAAYRTPTASITTTGTLSLTESNIQDLLQSIYQQTGKITDLVLLCGPNLKRAFTGFTRTQAGSTNVGLNIRTYTIPLEENKIVSTIDRFEGDFGNLDLMPSLFLAGDQNAATQARRGYIFDPENVEIRYGRRPRFMQLEDRGGGPRGLIDAIAGLSVFNPLGCGKIASTAD